MHYVLVLALFLSNGHVIERHFHGYYETRVECMLDAVEMRKNVDREIDLWNFDSDHLPTHIRKTRTFCVEYPDYKNAVYD